VAARPTVRVVDRAGPGRAAGRPGELDRPRRRAERLPDGGRQIGRVELPYFSPQT